MGCGASTVPDWETATTSEWPVYSIRRTVKRADLFMLDIMRPSGDHVLTIDVQLWTRAGRVSAKSLHPAAVTFDANSALIPATVGPDIVPMGEAALQYDPKERRLLGLRSYARTISKMRDIGSYDTQWRAEPSPLRLDGSSAAAGAQVLPNVISVVNAQERVCVYKGRRPENAQAAADRASAGDLLARVPTAHSKLRGRFEIAINPELDDLGSRFAGLLPLFLAIATEGFWAQGFMCLGQEPIDSPLGDLRVRATAEGPAPAVREGKNLFGVMQAQNIKEAKRMYKERERARAEREREQGLSAEGGAMRP